MRRSRPRRRRGQGRGLGDEEGSGLEEEVGKGLEEEAGRDLEEEGRNLDETDIHVTCKRSRSSSIISDLTSPPSKRLNRAQFYNAMGFTPEDFNAMLSNLPRYPSPVINNLDVSVSDEVVQMANHLIPNGQETGRLIMNYLLYLLIKKLCTTGVNGKLAIGHELQDKTSSRKAGDIYVAHISETSTPEVVLIVEISKEKFTGSEFAQVYKELQLLDADGYKQCLFVLITNTCTEFLLFKFTSKDNVLPEKIAIYHPFVEEFNDIKLSSIADLRECISLIQNHLLSCSKSADN